MYSKTELFNLALNALLLSKRIANADTDTSNEKTILETNFNTAFFSTLEDLDLNRTCEMIQLELITDEPNALIAKHWNYVYKYPTRSAFVRRIVTNQVKDNEDTRIPLAVKQYEGQTAILTNHPEAIVEIVDKNISLTALSTNAGLAVAHKLAWMCSPLLVGKNTTNLKASIMELYNFYKLEAQRHDYMENFNYDNPEQDSKWVRTRMG